MTLLTFSVRCPSLWARQNSTATLKIEQTVWHVTNKLEARSCNRKRDQNERGQAK